MAGRTKRTAEKETRRDRRIPTTRYEPDYREGLTSRQVQEHRLHGWVNRAVEPPSKTTKEIIHENVFTYFNLIFAVLAVLLCLVGSFRDLTFLPVIIFNTLIGIAQEIRAKQVLDKLTMLNAPRAAVVRDGKRSVIDAEELVIDDIVIFKAGNQVCADASSQQGRYRSMSPCSRERRTRSQSAGGTSLCPAALVVSGQCHARSGQGGRRFLYLQADAPGEGNAGGRAV